MAVDPVPQCNFLYGFFHFNLLEDTIDVEITMKALKGIHTFRKDHSAQTLVCSPWGSHNESFPSLPRKMEAYMTERQAIANPCN